MKKTNLRINNFFIMEKDNSYYLTDVDVLDHWKEIPIKDLKKFLKNKDCNEKIRGLMELYKIKSNVNFILPDFKKFNSSIKDDESKVIKLGGGNLQPLSGWQRGGAKHSLNKSLWGGSNSSKTRSWQSGGKPIIQWGGWPGRKEVQEENTFF